MDFLGKMLGGILGGSAGALIGWGVDEVWGDEPSAAPDPVDYNPAIDASVEASKANMAMFTAGQIEQTRMQTNMMNLMGMRMQQMEQGKLDTKLEIATMKHSGDMQEAQWRHDEKLIELLNNHVEALVDDGMIAPE